MTVTAVTVWLDAGAAIGSLGRGVLDHALQRRHRWPLANRLVLLALRSAALGALRHINSCHCRSPSRAAVSSPLIKYNGRASRKGMGTKASPFGSLMR